jgi:hypothetical protein
MSSVISSWAASLSSSSSVTATTTNLFIALALIYLTRRLFKSYLEPKPLVTVSASQEAREMAEEPKKTSTTDSNAPQGGTGKSIMQPPRTDLAPPKDDPFTLEQLKAFDGSDPSKPIYVSIKGTWNCELYYCLYCVLGLSSSSFPSLTSATTKSV